MIPTALLLIEPGTGDDWWRAPEHQALARLAFARWWDGLPSAALVAAGNTPGTGLPVEAERHFLYRRRPTLSPALWFWLRNRRIRCVLLAGPDSVPLASSLSRWGFDTVLLGQATIAGTPLPGALPWRIA